MRILTSRYKRIAHLKYGADGSRLFGFGESMSVQRQGRFVTFAGVEGWDPQGSPEPDRGVADCVANGGFCVLPDSGFVAAHRVADTFTSRAVAYDADGNNPLHLPVGHADLGFPIALSAKGDHLLVGNHSDPSAILRFRLPLVHPMEAAKRRPVPSATYPSTARGLAFEFPAAGDEFLSVERHHHEVLAQWRTLADLAPVGTPLPLTSATSAVRFAVEDCRLVAIAGPSLFSYDLVRPAKPPVKKVSGVNRKHFTGIAVHPDGRRVLATCNDETVREYDAVTLQELRAYGWKVGRLRCVAIAPDGLTAAAGSDTGKVVVWDLE